MNAIVTTPKLSDVQRCASVAVVNARRIQTRHDDVVVYLDPTGAWSTLGRIRTWVPINKALKQMSLAVALLSVVSLFSTTALAKQATDRPYVLAIVQDGYEKEPTSWDAHTVSHFGESKYLYENVVQPNTPTQDRTVWFAVLTPSDPWYDLGPWKNSTLPAVMVMGANKELLYHAQHNDLTEPTPETVAELEENIAASLGHLQENSMVLARGDREGILARWRAKRTAKKAGEGRGTPTLEENPRAPPTDSTTPQRTSLPSMAPHPSGQAATCFDEECDTAQQQQSRNPFSRLNPLNRQGRREPNEVGQPEGPGREPYAEQSQGRPTPREPAYGSFQEQQPYQGQPGIYVQTPRTQVNVDPRQVYVETPRGTFQAQRQQYQQLQQQQPSYQPLVPSQYQLPLQSPTGVPWSISFKSGTTDIRMDGTGFKGTFDGAEVDVKIPETKPAKPKKGKPKK